MATEKTSELKGPLPDDFPGRQALADAGINTYGQVRKAGDLTEIAGIGAATAAKIEAAMAGAPAAAPEATAEPEITPGLKEDGTIVLADGRIHDPGAHVKSIRVDTLGHALSAADDEFVEAELAKAK